MTTYVTPPGQGVTAGASPTEPAPATPTAATPETGEADAEVEAAQ